MRPQQTRVFDAAIGYFSKKEQQVLRCGNIPRLIRRAGIKAPAEPWCSDA